MRPDMLRPTSCDLGQGYTQYVRYDKTILVGNGHTSAVRCGSEPGSWSPNLEASLARRGRLPAAMAASGSLPLVGAGALSADLAQRSFAGGLNVYRTCRCACELVADPGVVAPSP